jgi:hypothetical protein
MFCLFEPKSGLEVWSRGFVAVSATRTCFAVCSHHVSAHASIASRTGASMDLAMAMGLSLFGIFTASTVLFFYRLPR